MDSELKEKWINALESGDYPKGAGVLRRADDAYCCLGVLCEVMGLESELEDEYYVYHTTTSYNDSAYLNEKLCEQIGLDYDDMNFLTVLNDRSNDFQPVIEYIKENV